MENRLRRGATFSRRVAAAVLVMGFAGTMAVAFALNGGWGDGLSLPALLAIMAASILCVLLLVTLFLMVARLMEGLAEVVGREGLSVGPPAGEGPAGLTGPSPGAVPGSEAAPGPESAAPRPAGVDRGRPSSLEGAVEHIRLGPWVKVTSTDGWTGWVRETDLPPITTPLPRTAAGMPYRPPRPSLGPGKPSGPGAVGR